MKRLSMIVLILVGMFGFSINARAAIPQTLNYQGVLTDVTGMAVSDGEYSIVFRLYTAASGGSQLWEETQSVTVAKGIFHVILGSVTPLDTLSFGTQYHLGISIEGEIELVPRIPLTASAYSINSRAVTGTSNILPSNGYAGIGTTDPQSRLHVYENTDGAVGIRIENPNPGSLSAERIDFADENGDAAGLVAYDDDDLDQLGSMSMFNDRPGGSIRFRTAAQDRMFINSAGNIGIGTLNPSELLHINGTARVAGLVLPVGASSGYVLTADEFGAGTWQPSGAGQPDGDWTLSGNDMYTSVSGNVGIGIANPTSRLHMTGGEWDLDTTEGDLKIGDDIYRLKVGVATEGVNAGSAGIRVQGGVARLILGAGSAEAVSIESDGSVVIGSATQAGTLDLYGESMTTPAVRAVTNLRGGLFYCYDELGNLTGTMQPDGHGTGGYFYLRRSESSTGFRIDGNYGGLEEPRVEIIGSSELAAFRMYETGDATVMLPVGAISSSEISDETGAVSYTSGTDGIILLSTPTILGSQSIVTPAAGYVMVLASGQAEMDHLNGTTSSFDFGVSDVMNTFPDNQDVGLQLNSGLPSGYYGFPVTVHGLFEVASAGSHTFYFLGMLSTGTCTCREIQLTLVYIPTGYGTVMPTLASGLIDDFDDGTRPALNAGDISSQRVASEKVNAARIERELRMIRDELEALKNELENR